MPYATFGRVFTAVRARMPVIITRARVGFVAGAITAMPAMSGEDFFEHKFVTNKNPDDIIDFYSTEDFLMILGIFPLALKFVLAGVEWDLERENTMAVHNAMEISFEITEKEEETAEGEKVVAFFQKRERFKNFIPFTRFIMWDQTQCYGYNRREDGTIEIFHRGESFTGPLPVRIIVNLHARYVIWATEKHINSPAFGVADLEAQEHQRSNIPLHVFNDFIHRLTVAQKIAIESGKIAAGSSTDKAEASLKKLTKLQQSPTTMYVNAVRNKANLKRNLSIEVSDPSTQAAIDQALAGLSTTKEGRTAAAEAVGKMVGHPEVVDFQPRYGGAFRAKGLK